MKESVDEDMRPGPAGPAKARRRLRSFWPAVLPAVVLAIVLAAPAMQTGHPAVTPAAPGGADAGPAAPAPGPDAGPSQDWKAYPSTAGPFSFPEDEGLHPAALEEWWYVNGHLVSQAGDRYDFMVCFYRHGIVVASLLESSTGTYINHSETFANIEREQGRLGLRFGPNELYQVDGRPFTYRLAFRNHDFELDLALDSRKPPLVVNGDGLISMGRGPSYYYSLTDLAASGSVRVGHRETAVSGAAWMDRQWGFWSPTLDWDWFSVKLDGGTQVLAYRILDGEGPVRLLVSTIDGRGNACHAEQAGTSYQVVLGFGGYWRSPDTGKLYSSGWELAVPALGLRLTMTPVIEAQETLFPADSTPLSRAKPFWEGACLVTGVLGGAPVSGRAFVETTLDYGGLRGDLVATPKEYVQEGDGGRVLIKVENRGGAPLDNVHLQLVRGSPYQGGKVLATYNVNNRHNSTYISSSLPDIGDAPLYIVVDPDNRFAESEEGNNIAVAVLK